MFYITLNKRNPVTFPQHARAHYCSTERHTRSFSKTLLALVAADTQGHAASCTNQVLASTVHQPFGFVLRYKPSSCFNTTSAFRFCPPVLTKFSCFNTTSAFWFCLNSIIFLPYITWIAPARQQWSPFC